MIQPAEELKEAGNRFYRQHEFDKAISAYNRAIIHDPNMPVYFTNRALCYMRKMLWDNVATDCRKALELDRKNVKANYFLGTALIKLGQFEEAVKVLMRANDLALHQKQVFGDEISAQIRIAKREIFVRDEEERLKQEIELQLYINFLIDDDLEKRLASLQSENDEEGNGQPGSTALFGVDIEYEEEVTAEDMFKAEAQANKERVNNLFAQVDERRRKREVPDYLFGKISFEILRDPVITPSGITYDRSSIKEHLNRVGHFDPVTGTPLIAEQLIPNLAMKEVVDHYLSENPWAIDA